MRSLPFKLLEVDWLDSSSMSSWRSFDEAMAWARGHALGAKTIGYLIYESDDRIALVQNFGFENPAGGASQVDSVMVIPKVSIISIREVRPVRKRKTKKR